MDSEAFLGNVKSSAIFMDEFGERFKNIKKQEEDKSADRSKFKKVEMSIFNGSDPNSWLF